MINDAEHFFIGLLVIYFSEVTCLLKFFTIFFIGLLSPYFWILRDLSIY